MNQHSDNLKAFKQLLENAPCGIGLFDIATSKPIYLNEVYYQMVGYTEEEYAQLKTNRIFQNDQEIRKASAEEFLKSGKALEYEYRIVHKDETISWLRVNASTVIVDGKKCAFVSFVDITHEKQSNQQFELITENIGSSLTLYHMTENNEVLIYANHVFYEYSGLQKGVREEWLEKFYSTVLSKEDYDHLKEEAQISMETGTPREVIQKIVYPNGKIMWVQRRIAALKQESEDDYLMVSIATDITKKREDEIRAKLEARRFELVIHEMNAAVIDWDTKTHHFEYTDAFDNYALSEVSSEDIFNNRGPMGIIHPDDVGKMQQFFKDARKNEDRAETVLRTKMKDGSFHWCKMLGFYDRNDDGEFTHLVGVLMDINEEYERNFMLNHLVNELPGGVAIIRLADRLEYQYFSDGFAALSGSTREQIDEMVTDESKIEKFLDSKSNLNLKEELRKITRIGEQHTFSYHFIQRDGTIRYLHVTASKIRDERGCPVFYCIFMIPTGEIAQYQNIVEDSAIGIFVGERKTRQILYTNKAFCTICKLPEKRYAGEYLSQVLGQYHRKYLLSDEEIASLSLDTFEKFHVERHGAYMSIKAKAVSWNDMDAYILYITDETDIMTAHEQMERNYIKEQALMNSIPGGTAIYRLKKDGRVIVEYASEGYCHLFGYTKEEVLGCEDVLNWVYPDDLEMAQNEFKAQLAKGKLISQYYRVVTKTGDVVFQRFDANQMTTEELHEDDIAVLYVVHSKVTDDAQLMMQEQKYYRSVLNLTGAAYFEWSKEAGFYASKDYQEYALFEGGFEALMGKKTQQDAIHPEDMPLVKHYMHIIDHNENGQSVTIRLKMRDGHYQWTEVVALARANEQGEFIKVVGIFRDVDKEWIEKNKKLQRALDSAERANRAKTAFLSRVSHDMRTPLNGILGITTFLKESVSDEKTKHDVEQLEISGQYLLNLINDTLDVSRIENGKLELHPVVCDGKEVFDNIIQLMKPGAEAKHLKLVVKTIHVQFTKLFIDIGRVEQIIMNIIGNAVKFTDEGGTITVTLEQLEDLKDAVVCKTTIRDTGIGMSKEFVPTIFDAFSQADTNLTNARQGTGLGMAITKQLVDLMKGNIEIESELGKGSTFYITLPFQKATSQQVAEWEKSLNTKVDDSILNQKRILLCEDHPMNRDIATRLLTNKGILVETASNGLKGVEMFKASTPNYYDAILMDVRMPKMDGLDATREIRKLEREDAHRIPIIAMTGNSFEEDIARTRDAGMNAHLSKPIDSVKLFATLREYLTTTHYFRRKKILVVDDVDVNRGVIQAVAEKDYDILQASDGIEAFNLIQQDDEIDLVITDIIMDQMDGLELIRKIRKNPKYNHIGIIANTQYEEMTTEQELREAGANAIMYKPNTPEDVMEKIIRTIMN